jgi:hypothetical protein
MQSSAYQPDAGVFPVTQPLQHLGYGQAPPFAQQQLYFVAQPPQQQQQAVFAAPIHSQVPQFVTASTQQPSKKLVYVPVLIDDEPSHPLPQPVETGQFSINPAPQPLFQYHAPTVQHFSPTTSQNKSHMLHPTPDPFKISNGTPQSAAGFVARDARSLDPAQTPKVKPPSKQVQKAEPGGNLNFSQICRHFVLGSCKLCRFRHPAGEELESLKKLSPEELDEATNEARPSLGGAVPPPPPSENGASDCASWLDSRESELGIQNLLRDLKE